jgi:hypothetical protein
VAHAALGEDGMLRLRHRRAVLVVDLPAAGDAAELAHVVGGVDGGDAGHGLGRRGVQAGQPRMGMRRSQDVGMELAGPLHVVHVLAAAGQEAQVLLALRARADAPRTA